MNISSIKKMKLHYNLFKISACATLIFVFLPFTPAEGARCQPENDCYMYPSTLWIKWVYECPCSADLCEFSIMQYACDDCWCNPLITIVGIPNDCRIFCMPAPITCEERIAINNCSTFFHRYQVHIVWLRVEDLDPECSMSCFNNCETGDIPECGVALCSCPRG
jgi:hypothetical protein